MVDGPAVQGSHGVYRPIASSLRPGLTCGFGSDRGCGGGKVSQSLVRLFGRLGGRELPPGLARPSRRGINAGVAYDQPDGACCDLMAEDGQLAPNLPISRPASC